MGKHRTKLTILANILSVIDSDSGAKKTRIMYKAYLSYGLLIRYLKEVQDARLVTCGEEKCYKLTQKGKNFLKKFNEYKDIKLPSGVDSKDVTILPVTVKKKDPSTEDKLGAGLKYEQKIAIDREKASFLLIESIN